MQAQYGLRARADTTPTISDEKTLEIIFEKSA